MIIWNDLSEVPPPLNTPVLIFTSTWNVFKHTFEKKGEHESATHWARFEHPTPIVSDYGIVTMEDDPAKLQALLKDACALGQRHLQQLKKCREQKKNLREFIRQCMVVVLGKTQDLPEITKLQFAARAQELLGGGDAE